MSKSGVRIDDDVYEYLFNNRTMKEKTISAVIRGLIRLKDDHLSPDNSTEPK